MPPLTKSQGSTCAEQIALCLFFHEVPSAPVRNQINERFLDRNEYILPFNKERGLANTIAFLARTKDGHDYIPAVALEQDPSGTSLEVLLAINKRTWGDGDDILHKLKEEFEVLFGVLRNSQYEKDSQCESRKTTFSSIIAMCAPRIKCRLGLKPKRKPIGSLLKEANLGIKSIDSQKLLKMGLRICSSSFATESKKVIQLVGQWYKYRTPRPLEEVVKGIHTMKRNCPGYFTLLDLIPNKDMNPSSRSSLVNMIEKVSRYRDAATKLYSIARKFPIVRNMKVKLVKLSPEAFEGFKDSGELPDLPTCVSRLGLLNGRRYNTSQICQQLNLDKEKAFERFERAQKSQARAKIHAEIQIIAFCEIEAPKMFPRTISSSKDACFLCNTFIRVYGRVHTPASHGRLYAGWKLPNIEQISALQQRFNKALTDSLRQSICTGLTRGKLLLFPYPNESTLLTLSAESTMSRQDLDPNSIQEGITTFVLPDLPEDAGREESESRQDSPLLSISTRSDSPISKVLLHDDERITHEIGRRHMAPYFITTSLEVYIEPEHEPALTLGKNLFRYTIEMIATEEMHKMKCPVVDARDLGAEVMFSLSEERIFCLVAGDVMLKISVYDVSEDHS